jgi:thioesterase domain-containing protein
VAEIDTAEVVADLATSELDPQTRQPGLDVEELRKLSLDDQLRTALAALVHASVLAPDADVESLRQRFKGVIARHRALLGYRARPYPGKVLLFRPTEVMRTKADAGASNEDPTRFWIRLALGGIDVVQVPGRHQTMCMEPHVRALASAISKLLDE